jgi:hypothetical protein
MPKNPFHWSFYAKHRPALQTALCKLRDDRNLKLAPLVAEIVEKGLRQTHPQLFEATPPSPHTNRTRK